MEIDARYFAVKMNELGYDINLTTAREGGNFYVMLEMAKKIEYLEKELERHLDKCHNHFLSSDYAYWFSKNYLI